MIFFFPRNIQYGSLFARKARVNTERELPGHPIILLKSNKFNMAAVSVKRSIETKINCYNSSKCAGHFCRGNKAPTAKQRHHTSCLSSWDGSVNWPYCSTIFFLARLEATSWCRAILFATKGIDCDNYDGSFCFV